MSTHRFHLDRKVRLHASGKWIVTIGKSISRTGKLVDKDWYFSGSDAEAREKANAKARQWRLLCTHWETTERPSLELLGEPMPHEPRWPNASGKGPRSVPAPETVQSARREGVVDPEETAQAYADFSFAELIPVYISDRKDDLKQKDVQNSSVSKDVSQMKQAARFLPNDMPAVQLTGACSRPCRRGSAGRGGRGTGCTGSC